LKKSPPLWRALREIRPKRSPCFVNPHILKTGAWILKINHFVCFYK
jgi:hypothetical protein